MLHLTVGYYEYASLVSLHIIISLNYSNIYHMHNGFKTFLKNIEENANNSSIRGKSKETGKLDLLAHHAVDTRETNQF